MRKTIDQAIYDELFKICRGLEYSAYDFLPVKGTPYPFVVLGAIEILPQATKSYVIGRVAATIDVWGTQNSRKLISDMAEKIVNNASLIRELPNGLRCSMRISDTNIRLLQDNTTNQNLWHGVIEMIFNFN